jgi:hypothetical protein
MMLNWLNGPEGRNAIYDAHSQVNSDVQRQRYQVRAQTAQMHQMNAQYTLQYQQNMMNVNAAQLQAQQQYQNMNSVLNNRAQQLEMQRDALLRQRENAEREYESRVRQYHQAKADDRMREAQQEWKWRKRQWKYSQAKKEIQRKRNQLRAREAELMNYNPPPAQQRRRRVAPLWDDVDDYGKFPEQPDLDGSFSIHQPPATGPHFPDIDEVDDVDDIDDIDDFPTNPPARRGRKSWPPNDNDLFMATVPPKYPDPILSQNFEKKEKAQEARFSYPSTQQKGPLGQGATAGQVSKPAGKSKQADFGKYPPSVPKQPQTGVFRPTDSVPGAPPPAYSSVVPRKAPPQSQNPGTGRQPMPAVARHPTPAAKPVPRTVPVQPTQTQESVAGRQPTSAAGEKPALAPVPATPQKVVKPAAPPVKHTGNKTSVASQPNLVESTQKLSLGLAPPPQGQRSNLSSRSGTRDPSPAVSDVSSNDSYKTVSEELAGPDDILLRPLAHLSAEDLAKTLEPVTEEGKFRIDYNVYVVHPSCYNDMEQPSGKSLPYFNVKTSVWLHKVPGWTSIAPSRGTVSNLERCIDSACRSTRLRGPVDPAARSYWKMAMVLQVDSKDDPPIRQWYNNANSNAFLDLSKHARERPNCDVTWRIYLMEVKQSPEYGWETATPEKDWRSLRARQSLSLPPSRPTASEESRLKLADLAENVFGSGIILLDEIAPLQDTPVTPAEVSFHVHVVCILIHPYELREDEVDGETRYSIDINTVHPLPHVIGELPVFKQASMEDIRNDILDHVSEKFELNSLIDNGLRGRWRWRCALTARCETQEFVVDERNVDVIKSASQNGGWTWYLYLSEALTDDSEWVETREKWPRYFADRPGNAGASTAKA